MRDLLLLVLEQALEAGGKAGKALEAAKAVFAAGGLSEDMPTTVLSDESFSDGHISIADLLVAGGLAPSKGEAKRLISQGGVIYGDKKAERFDETVDRSAFEGGHVVRKGKKTFHRFTLRK